MNIFVLHRNPRKAARMMCDKHVVKMILESAQMLCTVAHQNGIEAPYKPGFTHHPCTKWAGTSLQNWTWLLNHAEELCLEYTRRYNKNHKTEAVINYLATIDIEKYLPNSGLTPFAKAMPEHYKHEDAVLSYRHYYLGAKSSFATWKNTKPPIWWIEAQDAR